MVKNVAVLDRMIRIFAGIALISVADLNEGWVRWLALVGVALLVTGFMGFSPAYWAMGKKSLAEPKMSKI
jgi:hypothetical protein